VAYVAGAQRPGGRVSGVPGTVVLYDGDCRFCRAAAAALMAWDRAGRLAVVPFRDPLGASLTAEVPVGERFGSLHARGPDGRMVSGPDALALVLRRLPGGRALRAGGAHRLYRPVARRRARLGRLVPDRAPVRRVPPA
jgi:predicted DCC family thiol-disulfide oxidoreductase YuxK